MALHSSGCCHLVSRHQLTGQLLLSSASTQTPGLIKPQPRHSPINHLMMSYHGDHWAASIHTHRENTLVHTQDGKGLGRDWMRMCTARRIHTSIGVPKYILCPRSCPYPAACLGGVRNMKTLMKVAFDSTALIPGAARICVWAKHLFSPLISNISLFHWNQWRPWTVANGGLACSPLMLWAAISCYKYLYNPGAISLHLDTLIPHLVSPIPLLTLTSLCLLTLTAKENSRTHIQLLFY